MHVLDLGCSNGRFTRVLAPFCKSVTGYDISPALIQQARNITNQENVNYELLDVEDNEIKFPGSQAIFLLGVTVTINSDETLKVLLKAIHNSLQIGGGGTLVTRDSVSHGKRFEWQSNFGYYGTYRQWWELRELFLESGFYHIGQSQDLTITISSRNNFNIWTLS